MATTVEQLYEIFLQHPAVSTDTRKIAAGSIFFALKGEKFDANTFAGQAIAAGAAYAVIDDPAYQLGENYILVDNVLTALQQLARHHRSKLAIPVIGLTGTNGKTTTKELINAVLSQHFKTQATQGNLNNHIGVPLTILTIDKSSEIAVIEMGANHQQEIAFLCSIAQPTHGLITNVGKAHLEGFGGVEGVKKGKGELYDFLKKTEALETGGIAFISSDNAVLQEMIAARELQKIIQYGTMGEGNLVTGNITDNSPLLTVKWENSQTGKNYTVGTQLTGAYNLDNILVAICMGVYFGLSDGEINNGITGYQPKNNRSQILQTKTNTLICDYYNANPSSMVVAIENIGKLTASRKVLILGDMFEMGDAAAAEHEAVFRKAMEIPVDERIFIGKEFYEAASGTATNTSANGKNTCYLTAEEAIAGIRKQPIINSTILIKGSRGMALERLVELL